jgi:hypothetical protein
MDSPPFTPKPVIPSHLVDGLSPLGILDSSNPQAQNFNQNLQVVDFDGPGECFPKPSARANIDGSNCSERHETVHSENNVEGHNEGSAMRTPLPPSRAQSPYNQLLVPTIDFDDLSWPSRKISWHKTAS